LLLGGTGAIGSHLTNVLSDKGERVVVTSRSRNEINGLVEYRKGNAKNDTFLYEVLRERWDAIVDFMIYSVDEFRRRVNLLLNSTSHYIFLSSARVYNVSQEALTEESERLLDASSDQEFLATSEYSLSKARQEDILRSSNKKNWTIVRPYITYGEKRLQLGNLEKEKWLYRALKGKSIIFSVDIKNHLTTLTYSLDVAIGIASLINNPNSFGETYHITSDFSCKWSEVLNIYLDVLEEELGDRPKVIYQDLSDYLTWNPGKYQIIYDRLFARKFDNTKINEFINTKEFAQVQVGLRKCLKTFLENPEFKSINWKYEAIKDRFAKESTPLKEISGLEQKVKYLLYRYFINVAKIIERLIK
jgi:nucleoside-diphosphate-sugar epimerase